MQSWSCEHTGVFKAGGMDDITTGKQFLLPKPEPCEPRGKLRQRLVKDEGSLVSQVLLAVATLRPLVIRNLIGTETVSKPHQHASGDLALLHGFYIAQMSAAFWASPHLPWVCFTFSDS